MSDCNCHMFFKQNLHIQKAVHFVCIYKQFVQSSIHYVFNILELLHVITNSLLLVTMCMEILICIQSDKASV